MPRKLYGMYLNEILEEAMLSISDKREFKIVREEAIDIDVINEKGYIVCESGRIIEADKIILATGNIPPSPIRFDIPTTSYCNNPWECAPLEKVEEEKTVLMIGTGLTMVDLCATLVNNKHKGKIIAVSTHGYTPAIHENYDIVEDAISTIEYKNGLHSLFNSLRNNLRHAKQAGKNWRAIIDSLRPRIQEIWADFSSQDKRSFLKNLSRVWNISRHRIPPEYGEMLTRLIENGRLEIKKGRIIDLKKHDNKIEVTFKQRGKNKTESFHVNFVVNCTGPQINYSKVNQPLIKNILKKNLAETGELELGLNATVNGELISKGKTSKVLLTLGPALIGKLYETTAVPELREQVKRISEQIIHSIQLSIPFAKA